MWSWKIHGSQTARSQKERAKFAFAHDADFKSVVLFLALCARAHSCSITPLAESWELPRPKRQRGRFVLRRTPPTWRRDLKATNYALDFPGRERNAPCSLLHPQCRLRVYKHSWAGTTLLLECAACWKGYWLLNAHSIEQLWPRAQRGCPPGNFAFHDRRC